MALFLVTVAAIIGMHRLFVDGSYRGALVLQAILAHLVVTLLRRNGVRLVPAALATLVVAVLAISWTRFGDTLAWALPTADTFRTAGDDIGGAWSLFGDVKAPAPVENGFIVTTAIVVWCIAFLADWAAFRLSAAFEALLPATTLFVFAAALGGESSPVASAALFAAAALMFLLLRRTAIQERTSRWAGGYRHNGRLSLVGTGVALSGLAVVVGVVAGPLLPGADAQAVVPLQGINEDEPTRQVPSPIVSLQTRLVEQSDVQVFSVRSERSSYWRLTSLDEFDGEIWRSSYSTDEADGELPSSVESAAETETVEQEITIAALSSVWLPAAHEPVAIDPGPDEQVVYDERSSTLMVDRDVTTSDGYSYTVTSAIADWTRDELRAASEEVPDDIRGRYTDLPSDFPQQAADEAEAITAEATTPYDKALALQTYLRSDLFTYDKTVGPGHSSQALLTFLFETRRGYCEQFASTFAALARSVGLPSRVAVGFTPGEQDIYDPTIFTVKGVHAHAWPEVYLGEYGWVPFEPTISRGPPRASNWLGIEEQQDTSTGGAAVTDPQAPEPGAGAEGPVGGAGDENRLPGGGLGESSIQGGDRAGADDESSLGGFLRDVVWPLAVLAIAYLVLVPVALATRRWLQRRRARSPADRVRLAWRQATAEAIDAGVRLHPWMTVAEKAETLTASYPGCASEVTDLARRVEEIAYAEAVPSAEQVAAVEHDHATLVGEIRRRQDWPSRVARWFDVRRLIGTSDRTRVASSTQPAATLAD